MGSNSICGRLYRLLWKVSQQDYNSKVQQKKETRSCTNGCSSVRITRKVQSKDRKEKIKAGEKKAQGFEKEEKIKTIVEIS